MKLLKFVSTHYRDESYESLSFFGRTLLVELNEPLEHYDCILLSEPQKQEFTI